MTGAVPPDVYAQLEDSVDAMRRGQAGPLTWLVAFVVGALGLWIALRVIKIVLRIAGFVATISAIVGVVVYVLEVLRGDDDDDYAEA